MVSPFYGLSTRDAFFASAGGAALWIAQNPVKRGRRAYTVANWFAVGPPGKRIGLGRLFVGGVKYSGAAAAGAVLGAAVLVGGTYTAEKAGWIQEGSTDHAVDFATLQADNWYDYTVHYNAYRILESKFTD